MGAHTAGTTTQGISNNLIYFSGDNNITLSGNANTIIISGPSVAGAQTGISGQGVSDTTYSSGTVIFSASANITLGSSVNGASQYVRFSVSNQSTQTNNIINALSISGNNTSGVMASVSS